MSSARGRPPPASLPVPFALEDKEEAAALQAQYQGRPPASELTPLAISVLNDDAFVGRILAKRSQQQQIMQERMLLNAAAQQQQHGGVQRGGAQAALAAAGAHMPAYLQARERIPWMSNAVLASFAAEEYHQELISSPRGGHPPAPPSARGHGFGARHRGRQGPSGYTPRRAATARGASQRAAIASARRIPSPPPPSPTPPSPTRTSRTAAGARPQDTRSPTRGGGSGAASGQPVLWTRPITVDGPGVANALAFQQASLA